MADGADNKERLARLRLTRKLSGSGEQAVRPNDGPIEDGLPPGLAQALTRDERGAVSVDLRRITIPLSVLSFVPRAHAQERLILPLHADGARLLVAVADPTDRSATEELARTSGREVRVYVGTHGMLRDVIEQAYAAQSAGASTYSGALVWQSADSTLHESPCAKVIGAVGGEGGPLARSLSEPPLAMPEPRERLDQTVVREPRPRRVLVADADPASREVLTRALSQGGYETIESATGLETLQQVREWAPDVLMLDAQLPELNGFEVCRRIKASRRYGHIHLIMLSGVHRGWRFAADLQQSYGVDELLEKPLKASVDVLTAVERALAGHSGRAEPEPALKGGAERQLRLAIDADRVGDRERAIEHLERGIEADPRAFRLHYHLGLLYGKQDKVFEAIQTLETAISLQPRDFSTLKNLAVLYQRAGFRLKATEMWERALASAPNEATRSSIRNHLVSLL